MKFIHIADLHIGKSLGEIDLYEDQKYALDAIIQKVREHQPEAVLIAGDVYDKAQPSARAVELADQFFTDLVAACGTVCVIGGNHDSHERLSFARRILSKRGLHIAGGYEGRLASVECGSAVIWMMPFFRPREAAAILGITEDMTYDQAVRAVIGNENIDPGCVNILLAHQFVIGGQNAPETCESEVELSTVGGIAHVDYGSFDAFDYVALGHLHGSQQVGREAVRYAGSPIKYSASEDRHIKTFVLGEIEKGMFQYTLIPITCLRNLRRIKGELGMLTRPETVALGSSEDLIDVTLTDAVLPPDAPSILRQYYPNVFHIGYQPQGFDQPSFYARRQRTAGELFREFYSYRNNGRDMDERMVKYMDRVIEEAGREDA